LTSKNCQKIVKKVLGIDKEKFKSKVRVFTGITKLKKVSIYEDEVSYPNQYDLEKEYGRPDFGFPNDLIYENDKQSLWTQLYKYVES
jgi:hypothetical protein